MRVVWGWGGGVALRHYKNHVALPLTTTFFFALGLYPDQSYKRVTRIRGLIVCHIYFVYDVNTVGTRYRSWLRHYATSREVAGSILDEIIGFLN
jgi:hypothetical protein